MDKLPLLISIPHGGDQIPKVVKHRAALTPIDIFIDGDSLTREIYDFKSKVIAQLDTPIARAIVDLNRKPDDLAPKNPDGVIKSFTVTGAPVYKDGCFPDSKTKNSLLKKYYFPYHQQLNVLVKSRGVRIAFDCHSMLANAPVYNHTAGKKRPLICLSNAGDQRGFQMKNGENITCAPEPLQQLAECFREAFGIPYTEVALNVPFKGGHIIRSHYDGTIPWIQIEINKKLYLPSKDKKNSIFVPGEKVASVKEKIWTAFNLFFLNF